MKRKSFSKEENKELMDLCVKHNGDKQEDIYSNKVIEAAARDFFKSTLNVNSDGEKKHKLSTIKKHIKHVINYHDDIKKSTFDVKIFEDLKSIHHNNYEEIANKYYQLTGLSYSGSQLRNFDFKRKNLKMPPSFIKENPIITTVQQPQVEAVENLFDVFTLDEEQLVWTL